MPKVGFARKKLAVGAIGALALAGAGGVAYGASAGSGSGPGPGGGSGSSAAALAAAVATPAPASPKATPTKIASVRRLLRRADQATVEVKVHGAWTTYTMDRGKVSAISSTSITLALPDGHAVTDRITGTTQFRGVTSAISVKVGVGAVTVSQDGSALAVAERKAAPASGSTPTTSASTAAAA